LKDLQNYFSRRSQLQLPSNSPKALIPHENTNLELQYEFQK
jgi:hypothetical protein